MAIGRFYWVIPDALAGCSRPGGAAGHAETLQERALDAFAARRDWLI